MGKLRDNMKDIAKDMIRTKAAYEFCNERGYHNKIDASYTDWQGNPHQLEMCVDCKVYFSND